MRKKRASAYILGLSILWFPVARHRRTYDACPQIIPSEMLYVSGINIMQMKAGMASR